MFEAVSSPGWDPVHWGGASQHCVRAVVVPLSTGQIGMADGLQDSSVAPAV